MTFSSSVSLKDAIIFGVSFVVSTIIFFFLSKNQMASYMG